MIRLARFWFRNPTDNANSIDISYNLIYLLPVKRLLFPMLGNSCAINVRKRVISLRSDYTDTLLKGIQLNTPPMAVSTMYYVTFVIDLLLLVLIKFKWFVNLIPNRSFVEFLYHSRLRNLLSLSLSTLWFLNLLCLLSILSILSNIWVVIAIHKKILSVRHIQLHLLLCQTIWLLWQISLMLGRWISRVESFNKWGRFIHFI